MTTDILKIWMPIKKTDNGKFSAILTDTSLDRDNELMSEGVMDALSKQLSLPALADHENKMDSWIGTFQNLQKVHSGNHYAVTGEPTFFSKEANPRAQQIKKQIEEAADMGGSCGISIGAKPKASEMVEKNGKQYKQWTDIEIMEATFTPVQSNRNSYTSVAKSFGLDKTLSPKVESCVKQLKAKGMDKEKAIKICQSKVGNKCIIADLIKVEENTMKKTIKKNPDEGEPKVPVEDAPKEEVKEEIKAPEDSPKEPEAKTPAEEPEKSVEIDVQKLINEGIAKAMAKIPKLKAIQEVAPVDTNIAPTMGFIESQIAKRYNFKEAE